jgi:hypothetical protein
VSSRCVERHSLAINPLIYAEVSIRFGRIEKLEDALPTEDFLRLALPSEGRGFARTGTPRCGDRQRDP